MRIDPDRLTCDLTTEVCACDLHAGHTGQHRCVCGIRWGEHPSRHHRHACGVCGAVIECWGGEGCGWSGGNAGCEHEDAENLRAFVVATGGALLDFGPPEVAP